MISRLLLVAIGISGAAPWAYAQSVETREPPASIPAASPLEFDAYFTEHALRFEMFQVGHKDRHDIIPAGIYEEPLWPGNRQQPIFPFPYGKQAVRVYDHASGSLIYSFGFDTLFCEYATTPAAARGENRVFPISVRIPKPKARFRITIDQRQRDNSWTTLWEQTLKPTDSSIHRESIEMGDTVLPLQTTGSPDERLDIVFLSEGYTQQDQDKFQQDAQRMTDFLFEHEPYRGARDRINATAIFRPSRESGTDEPGQRRHRNTALHSSFNTLGIDRYLLIEDAHTMHRMAAQAPYDSIVVLVNSKRYGGGAICMDFCVTTVDDALSPFVFLHEFGHSLAYLADEYTGAVTYSDMYPEGVEPVEPNITRSLDRDAIKWKEFLTPEAPLPTPTSFRGEGMAIEDVVGAFEGGGYLKSGMYRPQAHCAMGNLTQPIRFCVACDRAIRQMIDYYAPSPQP